MGETASSSKEFLGTEPLRTLIPRLAVPMVASQLVNLLYSIVDRIFVGHIPGAGADALTGIGVCMPLIAIVLSFAMWPGVGGGPFASRELGAGRRERAEAVFRNSFTLLIVFGVALMAVLIPLAPWLLAMFGASAQTLPYANAYAGIYLLGTLFVMGNLGLSRFLVAQGSTRQVLVAQAIGAVSNIALNALFLFVLGLGIRGSAASTVIAQFLSCAVTIYYLRRPDSVFRDALRPCCLDVAIVRETLVLGLAPFFVNITESLLMVVLNSQLQLYGGDTYVGCMTIMQSITSVIWTPTQGITHGSQSVIAYSYGARMVERTKRSITAIVWAALVCEFVLTALAMLFPQQIAMLFTTDAAVVELAGTAIPVFVAGLLVFGAQLGVQASFIALGLAKYPIIVATVRKLVLLIPLALVLPLFMGAWGVFVAEPISDVLSVCMCLFMLRMCWKSKLSE